MPAFSSNAFSTNAFSSNAFSFDTGGPPPPAPVDIGVKPSGGIPAFAYADRGPSKEQKLRSRTLHGLEAEVVFTIAQRQAEHLDLDELQRKEELLAELRLQKIEARAIHFEELTRQREALIDAEIASRLRAVMQADEDAAVMILMIGAII